MRTFLLPFFLFFICSTSAFSQTFTYNFTAQPLPVSYNSYTLNVAGLPSNSDATYGFLEVSLNMMHTDARRISIELVSPAGTSVALINNVQDSISLSNTTFRTFASKHILEVKTGALSGTLMPYSNDIIYLQNGQNPNGDWVLNVADWYDPSDSFTLNSWELNFVPTPIQTSVNEFESKLPLIKITTPSGSIPNSPKENGTLEVINQGSTNRFNMTGTMYNVGVERQGYTSAWGDKHNVDIEFRNSNYSLDSIVNFLNFSPESDFILKGCVTDGWLMKDPFTFEMSRRIGYYAPHTQYVEVMMNNEYKGLYIAEEKIKRDSQRVDISKLTPLDTDITGGYLFEINPNGKPAAWYSPFPGYQGTNITNNYEYKMVYPKSNTITAPQQFYIKNFVDSFEYAMHDTLTFQNPLTGWRKWANEKSIIDFILVSEYSNNYDTYGRSNYFFKEKASKGNKIKFGPPWDADRGYDASTSGWVHLITHGYWVFPFWYQHLRGSDSLFNKRMACRYHTIRQYHMSNVMVDGLIDTLSSTMLTAGYRNEKKHNVGLWSQADFKSYVHDRLAWMDAALPNLPFAPAPLTTDTFSVGDTVTMPFTNGFTYNFIPGPDTNFFALNTIGNYVAEITTNYGCQTRQAFAVIATPFSINSIQLQGATTFDEHQLKWSCINQKGNGVFEIIQIINGVKNKIAELPSNATLQQYNYVVAAKNRQAKYKIQYLEDNIRIAESNELLLSNLQSEQYLVYPNPATDKIFIRDAQAALYKIHTNAGVLVMQGKLSNDQINIEHLAKSTFLLTVVREDGTTYATQFEKK